MLAPSYILVGSLLAAGLAIGQQKPVVAIAEFNDSGTAFRSRIQMYFGTGANLGAQISDMLATQLAESGRYQMKERAAVDMLLKEHNFSSSNSSDQVAAAKLIGAVTGADAFIVGEITAFGSSQKTVTTATPKIWSKIGNIQPPERIEIAARLIETSTGEVLASATGVGTIYPFLDPPYKDGIDFRQSPGGRAVEDAVTQLATNLNKKVLVALRGFVADASGGMISVNVGSDQSIKVGDTLSVVRNQRLIRDPVTGKGEKIVEQQVGTIKITSSYTNSALGMFSGTASPAVGDRLRWPSPTTSADSPSVRPSAPPVTKPDDAFRGSPVTHQPTNDDNATTGQYVPSPAPGTPVAPGPVVSSPPRGPSSGSPSKSSKVDEYAAALELARWKDSLKSGAVEYRVPAEMIAGVADAVTVDLHGYADQQNRALAHSTGAGLLSKVSAKMKVELFDPDHPKEFNIVQNSGDPIQSVPIDGYATWMWTVTPADEASSEALEIRISLVHDDTISHKEQILEEKLYTVNVKVQEVGAVVRRSFQEDPIAWFKTVLPGGAYWTTLTAVFAWLGSRVWRKGRKRATNVAARSKKESGDTR